MTRQEYAAARAELDRLNKAIDDAPPSAKPVFAGIAKLHAKVTRYERANKLSSQDRK